MEIKISEAKIEGKNVSAVATFHSTLVEIEALGQLDRYGAKEKIAEKVANVIANRIADEYIIIHKGDIMCGIDTNKLINGIQVKIVEGFSLQRNL